MKRLLRKLIQAESTAEKGELAAADIISGELERSGIDSRTDSWGRSRANLIAQIKSAGHKGALLFACHLDIVGCGEARWKHPPFAGVESDGKIYGRGSADMKGGIAAVITAIRQIADSGVKLEGDIILFATAGEETDSCGTKRFIRVLLLFTEHPIASVKEAVQICVQRRAFSDEAIESLLHYQPHLAMPSLDISERPEWQVACTGIRPALEYDALLREEALV